MTFLTNSDTIKNASFVSILKPEIGAALKILSCEGLDKKMRSRATASWSYHVVHIQTVLRDFGGRIDLWLVIRVNTHTQSTRTYTHAHTVTAAT